MDSQRYQRVRHLFHAVADLDGDARRAYLDAECADDPTLISDVLRLLEVGDAQTGAVFERPAADAVLLRAALLEVTREDDSHALPTLIGPYEVVSTLGRGGMGVVYEARQQHPRRNVAVKLLHPGMVSPAAIRRFQREAHILGQLQHPGIVQVFEASTDTVQFADGSRATQPYVAMELVQADPLQKANAEFKPTLAEKLTLIAQVCDAVQYAHQRGVVHRDLKPSNILVARSKDAHASAAPRVFLPKILDFGVARLEGRETLVTSFATDAGQIIGTLTYMSPEQAGGDPNTVDTRSDVYSLGVILYELLAGKPPFEIRTPSILTAARVIQHEDPPTLGTIDSTLRGDVSTIVATAMEKDLARRYQSAGELAEDIRRFLRNDPIQARPPTAGYLVRKFAHRHRALVFGASATILAMVFGLVGVTWFAIQADQARRLADQRSVQLNRELYTSRIEQIQRIIETDGVDSVRPLLDDCDPELRGWEWQRLNWLADRSHFTFHAHEKGIVNLQFSPDGRYLLTSSQDGKVRLWDAESLSLVHEHSLSETRTWAQFSADGAAVVLGSYSGVVRVLDSQTFDVTWEHRFPETRVESAAVDRSGSRVAVGWWTRGPHSEVWNIAADRLLYTLDERAWRGNTFRFSLDGQRLLVGTLDGDLSLYCVEDGSPIFQQRGAKSVGLNAVFSNDETRVASIGADGALTIRDAATGEVSLYFDTRKGTSRGLAFHPDGKSIAVGSIDGVVTLFNVEDGARIDSLRGHDARVSAVAFRPDGRVAASSGEDGTVKIWDLSVIDTSRRVGAHAVAAAPSANGRFVYYGGYSGGLQRWNLRTGVVERSTGPLPHVRFISTCDERPLVAAWMSDGQWDNATGMIVQFDADLHVHHSWPANRPWVPGFSSDGFRLLTRADDGTVSIRSTATGDAILEVSSPGDEIVAAVFAADGSEFLSGHNSGKIGVWSASTGARVAGFKAHDGPILQLGQAGTGRLLATWARDEPVRIWEWKTGRLTSTIQNVGDFRCLALLPDETRLATGGADGNVRLWEVASGRELLRVGRHLEDVSSVAFDALGSLLTSSSIDHTVRIWNVELPN